MPTGSNVLLMADDMEAERFVPQATPLGVLWPVWGFVVSPGPRSGLLRTETRIRPSLGLHGPNRNAKGPSPRGKPLGSVVSTLQNGPNAHLN